MKNRILSAVILGAALSAPQAFAAETVYSAASRQNPLDNTGATARAVAMGSAFAGVADDASAVLWNPAGLSGLAGPEASVNHCTWFTQTFQEVLIVGLPVHGAGGFGITGNYLGYGSFEGRDFTGAPTSDYTANQMGLGVGWGRRVAGDLSVGAGLHGAQQTFAENSYSLFGGDLGVLLSTQAGWRFGLSYMNLGLNRQGEKMASSLRMGLSRRWGGKDRSVLTALGGTLEPQIGNSVQAGLEASFRDALFLRAGYDLRFQETGYDGLQGLTAGVGVALQSFRLDYAYVPYGDIGNTQRISLSYQLGPTSGAAQPAGQVLAAQAIPSTQPGPAPATVPSAVQATSGTTGQTAPQALGNSTDSERTITMEFEIPAGEAVARAKALAKEGKWADSIRAYQDILKKNPKDAVAWREMGNVYYRLGKKEYTIRCFEEALKLKPDDKPLAEWLERYKAQ